MNREPTSHYLMGDYLLGIEGLAILRTALNGRFDTLEDRKREIAGILRDLDSPLLSSRRDLPSTDIDAGYTAWSETYDAGGLDHDPIQALEGPAMRKLMDDLPDGPVLDVGSGTGRHTRYLAEAGRDVKGVEPNAAMLKLAQDKFPEIEFVQGDLSSLPAEDETHAAVICGNVFSHLAEIGPPIKEIARVLRPRGRALISLPHPMFVQSVVCWRAPAFDAKGSGWYVPEYPHLTTEFIAGFREAGLVPVQCLEPALTPEHARWSPTAKPREENPFGDALEMALAGQPGVMVWEAEKT